MNVEQLQAIVDQIYLGEPGMKHPVIRIGTGRCKRLLAHNYLAHAHSTRASTHHGWICFRQKTLDTKTDAVILDALAHELAHIRRPHRRHYGNVFRHALVHFQLRVAEVVANDAQTEKTTG